MTKKQRANLIIEELEKEYPLADCTLDYDEAWKLLVSVRLAAQCTDARVNVVVKDLFGKYPSPQALAQASVEEIEEIVRPCGLGASKARDIYKCMNMLVDQFGGQVPDDFDALLSLPGVGRKSANLIMGDVCVWQAGDRDRYALYPSGQSDGTGRWYKRSEESGNGTLEDHSGRKRK